MPITLTPNRTQYTSRYQHIEVKMERDAQSDAFWSHVKAKNRVILECTIQHGVAVTYQPNQPNQLPLFARGSSTKWTCKGHIEIVKTVHKDAPQWDTYIFTPNALPDIVPALPPDTTQDSNLQRLYLTLMFGSQVLDLILPVSRDWTGTLTIAFTTDPGGVSIGQSSSPLTLVSQPWGLPSVRSSQQTSRPRATYGTQPANRLVKLYNDASENALGTQGAFADICAAIAEARHFIFIADWSFHPDTYMQRPANGPNNNDKIGMILLNKARQHAEMVIAIHTWYHIEREVGPFKPDDPKNNAGGRRLNELCAAANVVRPRNLLWRMTERSGLLWSHHQKFVVLDALVDPNNPNNQDREIKVFFGGLDLTTGRFDWPDHLIHYDANNDSFYRFCDWYNPEFAATVEADTKNVSTPGSTPSVPRQPWHDIHAQLLGLAAWDFLEEFVGRWQARGTLGASQGINFDLPETSTDTEGRVWKKYVELWDKKDGIKDMILPHYARNYPYPQATQSRPWTVQICRSMDQPFWDQPTKAVQGKIDRKMQGISKALSDKLAWKISHKKSPLSQTVYYGAFEKSIHKAYRQAIARAEDFIYIETQYLIGESKLKQKSTNRIPLAIIDRILAINRITPQRDFHVYIVTPLYPEGDPLDRPVQPVRYNQWETMKWMQNQLANNLQGGKQWTDYLSFYFLGQRNGAVGANYPNPVSNTVPRQQLVAASNRYMIYVHSKLMIVDDCWIILGSANLNERSMAGNRDSEICVAMWPTPGYQYPPGAQTAEDQIKTFRVQLWQEHLVGSAGYAQLRNNNGVDAFDTPKAAATVSGIRAAAQHNFSEFIKHTAPNQMGHLMYWDWNSIDTGYLPDSPAGETKLLWAPQSLGLPPVLDNAASLAEWSPDGFR